MTISELITELQQIESTHGNLQVRIEAKAIGLTYDNDGNAYDDRTISAPAINCVVEPGEGGMFVWLLGTAEPAVELDEDEADEQLTAAP
jgi:hypothetical protein